MKKLKSTCSYCKQLLPLDFFYLARQAKQKITSICKLCSYLYDKLYYQANQKKLQIRSLKNYHENRDNRLKSQQEYYQRTKPHQHLRMKKWKKDNPENTYKHLLLRDKRLNKATPKCLSKTNKKQLEVFYTACPPGYHVDHIIPLTHHLVSGLHVLANLQYLPATENLKKKNKWP